MKTYTFLRVLAPRPHINGVFGHQKTETFANALQRGAIRKRQLIVLVRTGKTETFEDNDRQYSFGLSPLTEKSTQYGR